MENMIWNTENLTLGTMPKQKEGIGWISLPLEEFMQQTEELLAAEDSLKDEKFWQKSLNRLEEESKVKYMFLLYRMAETELLQKIARAAAVGEVLPHGAVGEIMESCIYTGRAFYEALYRPECFSKRGILWMPADCRYNDILVHFLDGGKRKLSMLLDAAKLRPSMVPAIKAWLAELGQ